MSVLEGRNHGTPLSPFFLLHLNYTVFLKDAMELFLVAFLIQSEDFHTLIA